MKIKKITILAILSLLLFIGCSEKENTDDDIFAKGNNTKQQMTTFNLKTVAGEDLKLVIKDSKWVFQGYENKVILLNFFGTWCPPCKAEIPHLLNIKQKLATNLEEPSQTPFEVIAVDLGQRDGTLNSYEELMRFIDQFGINYPIVTAADNLKLFSTVREINPSGSIPFMMLFNKKGDFIKPYVGMQPEEMLYSDITKTIEMK